jgi:cytochrome c551/c552
MNATRSRGKFDHAWLRRHAGALALLAIALPAFAASPPEPVRASDAQRLLGKYKCYICHADREAKAGPAYADVAAYFRGRPDAVSTIAREIRRGRRGGGPWHMPPHPEVSAEEARAMARYIMSLHARTAAR